MDRLEDIKKACHARVYGPAVSDVSWLIQEVELLRKAKIIDWPPVSGDLEVIFARSFDRNLATQKDTDWLIGQVATLRQQTELLRKERIADLEQLLDQARRSNQALGGFDPNIPAHGALRLLALGIKRKLDTLHGKESNSGN